jgi:signal transduction histidine kinase
VLNIVESLKGSFELESELGQGTQITIILPTVSANSESVKPIPNQGARVNNHRI